MTLRYVDGYKLRQTLDVNFNVAHFRNPNPAIFDSKWYIPEGELWLDHRFKDEAEFLTRVETAEPLKDRAAYRETFCKKGEPPHFVRKEETRDGLTAQYVDGKIVREYLDPLFVMGGHDLIYSYIPKHTIWIDEKLDPRDIPHVLLHEQTERRLMHESKSYDVAHDYASAAEKESRRKTGGCYIGDGCHSGTFTINDYYA